MEKWIFSLMLFITTYLNASIEVKTYYEKTENGYIYYADNNEYCPVSIQINFELNNLKSTKGNNKIYVLPAKTERIEITRLEVINKGKYGFNSSTKFNYGDHYLKDYDDEYIYYLPYSEGEAYRVMQGYNGNFSHNGQNALDFDMPLGTSVISSRDGVVIKVVDINDKGCPEEECKKYNNSIIIYHNDGTFAEYAHIKQNGAKVKVGERINKGQVLAESGNVGWSSDPHLHFEVYIQRLGKRETIKTKFKIENEGIVGELKKNEKHLKDY